VFIFAFHNWKLWLGAVDLALHIKIEGGASMAYVIQHERAGNRGIVMGCF
jgi:hypothetical protein